MAKLVANSKSMPPHSKTVVAVVWTGEKMKAEYSAIAAMLDGMLASIRRKQTNFYKNYAKKENRDKKKLSDSLYSYLGGNFNGHIEAIENVKNNLAKLC